MKKITLGVLGLAALMLLTAKVSAEIRTWTRASDGAKIQGEFVRMKDDKTAYIKREGGQTVEIPVAALSADDQAYIGGKSGNPAKPALPAGETTLVVTGAHLCCGGCRDGVMSAVTGIEGLTATVVDKVITLKGTTGEVAKKGLDAIAKAGYYGASDNTAVKIDDVKVSGDEAEVAMLTVSDVHLCCGSCVRAMGEAIAAIPGATHDAQADSPTFTIKGEKLKASAVLAAIRAKGFNATVK